MREFRAGDLKIKIEEPTYANFFTPQIILPERTMSFFMLHPHHLPKDPEFGVTLVPSIGGEVEKLEELRPQLEDFIIKLGYGWNELVGHFVKRIYPYIQGVLEQVSVAERTGEEIRIKTMQVISARFQKPEVAMQLFAGLSLPFAQLLPTSLAAWVSKYVLDASKRLLEGLGSGGDRYTEMDEVLFTLYKSGRVLFPLISTTMCTNTYQPHYEFILSSMPVRDRECRICKYPTITFNLYLLAEPYASLKMKKKDVSYAIAAYLSNKSAGELECFPEAYVKKDDGRETQVDAFIRNWVTGTTAVVECKTKENPRASFDTKVDLIGQELTQLTEKMKILRPTWGYMGTNLIFENSDEENRVLTDAAKKKKIELEKNIGLLGRIPDEKPASRLDVILSDLSESSKGEKETK